MKRTVIIPVLLSCLSIIIIGLNSCAGSQKEIIPSSEFAPYINAYTGGVISQSSPIRIELTQDQPVVDLNNELKENPFRFSPSLKGKAYWVSNNTIEFLPEEGALKQGTMYEGSFQLGEFVTVDKRLKEFNFSFRVQEKNFSLAMEPLDITATAPDYASVKGEIRFSDKIDNAQVEKILSASGNGTSSYNISIEGIGNPTRYTFSIGRIPRAEKDYELEIKLDGKAAGIDRKMVEKITIPAKNIFRFMSAQRIEQPENGIQISFSDPVSDTQDLKGLIEIPELSSYTFQVINDKVNVYFEPNRANKLTLRIYEGVKNMEGKRLGTSHSISFSQPSLKPQVELRTEAAILPDSKNLIVPFRAVSLHAVDLSVIRIYESNVLMFMQSNSLASSNELRRSGRLVYKQTLHLDRDPSKDIRKWEDYSIDLSGLINQEPGAIYRIILSFKQAYSAYPCGEEDKELQISEGPERLTKVSSDQLSEEDEAEWDTPQAYYYYNGSEKMDWRKYRWAETDKNGFAVIDTKGVPFFVVAEAGKQKAYVRVADGEEQSVSRFDVGGKDIQKGLKGFIYGERGVWRPGDTLHISFMLEDRNKRIPDKHPVALEIYNPRGQFYNKLISTNGMNGLYTFAVPTKTEDPTGLWNAYVKVGGTAFHKSLRIETVKPNRLKINLQLPGNILKATDGEVRATLSSAWLTGAKASRLKTKVEMSLSKVNTQFKNYGQYIFNNPATEFTSSRTDVFSGMLDTEGDASFTLKLPESGNAPGMLQANITARVFEPGGDASIYTMSVPYSPFSSYVGINLNQPKGKYIETDKDHIFDIVTVTPEGKPVNRSGLEYKIYRIDWSWWWENSRESFETYVNSSSYTPVATGKINTVNGKGSFKFRIDYPGWGRYLVYVKDTESGHATGGTVYVDWPEWRGRSSKTDPNGIKMLAFSIDKDSYEIGETVTAIIPASAGGRALATLENGSTVLQREWIDVSGKEDTKYQFKVTPEMAPNVYLHISLLQPHAQTINDLPIRMYGVMPVFVTNRETMLEPQIQMPDVLRPETEFSVTVSEKKGKAMTYTLAIVDDGLLDLTNFKTPDPWNDFYAREALGIRTWDMYDDVLGAYTGSYNSLFSTGGDETLKPADTKANRFKPVVRFIGPFSLSKGKSRTHRITLPMYVGSVRTMVVAGENGAYGHVEKTTPVRTPLMILSTLPRVLSTQEEILLPVNIFAMEKEVKNVKVSVSVSGSAQVNGEHQQSVTFAEPGDQLVYFRLKTGSKPGKTTVRLTAEGAGKKVSETIEIEVRNPNPAITLRENKWIESGQSCELSYKPGSNSPENSVKLEVSRIPSVDISRRFDFLYNYQHYCTEQLTSKALPLLFVGQFKAVDEAEAGKIKANVQEAIKQLYSRQLPNGGFLYWPGNASANEWITSYAGMFLVMAQEKGYAVNANVLNKWKRFQRSAAQNWRTPQQDTGYYWQSDLQQAFRLYTLALAGAPEHGAMNRMKEMQQDLSLQAKWRLAAAYALNGKTKAANELVFNAKTTVEPYSPSAGSYVYGSYDRDEAMILETLLLMGREREAFTQAQKVSKNLSREDWFSTQSTAFALMAMGRLAEKLSGTLDFTWTIYGKQQPAVKSAKAVFEKALSVAPGGGSVTVKNNGKGALNVDLITKTQLLNDTLPALSNNLRLDVKYTDMNGTAIAPEALKQGSDFMAVVTVANISGTTDYSDIALTHIIPSGWEIYNERMTTDPEKANSADSNNSYSYRDIRDDRVLTYFNLKRGQYKTFTVRLQATYAGTFVLPAIQCEAMYDAGAQARTRAGKAIVER